MRKLAIGVALFSEVNAFAYGSHVACILRVAKAYPEAEIVYMTPQRMTIDRARNEMVAAALREGCEFLFQYDDDTVLHSDTIVRLLHRMEEDPELFAIQPAYYIRGWPYSLMAFKKTAEDTLEVLEDEDVKGKELVYCTAIGNGCSLIRLDMVRQLPGPRFFKTGDFHTEDVYFYMKADQYLKSPKVAVDMTFTCGHLLGTRVVDHNNIEWTRMTYKLAAKATKDPRVFTWLREQTKMVNPELMSVKDIYDLDFSFAKV